MKLGLRSGIAAFLLTALFSASPRAIAQVKVARNAIESRSAEIDGVTVHYLAAGQGACCNPSAWLHADVPHVAASHS